MEPSLGGRPERAARQGAGALVLDREGREHTLVSTSTVAVAPGLADELLELLRP